jgi:threonyl-tRNA synthetase
MIADSNISTGSIVADLFLYCYLLQGGGLVFWHSKGAIIKREIESYWTNKHIEVRSVFATNAVLNTRIELYDATFAFIAKFKAHCVFMYVCAWWNVEWLRPVVNSSYC